MTRFRISLSRKRDLKHGYGSFHASDDLAAGNSSPVKKKNRLRRTCSSNSFVRRGNANEEKGKEELRVKRTERLFDHQSQNFFFCFSFQNIKKFQNFC